MRLEQRKASGFAMENGAHSATTRSRSPPRKTFRDVIKNFTPAWFAVNMGTGIVSTLFHTYPYGGHTKAMNVFALVFFFLNLVLFIAFLALTISRYIMFPHVWGLMLRHPVQSLYVGCFPMGGVTLINSGLTIVSQYWGFGGVKFLWILWALWWLDCVISFVCCFGLVYMMTTRHQHSMSTLTPLWLLPVVTLIVASSAGQLLATALIPHSLPHAFLTMGVSIVMVVVGISLAFMILTLYFRRLLIEGLPEVGVIISSFLPLGPCGQAGYSFLIAGQNFKKTLPWGEGNVLGDELAGQVLNLCCFFAAFFLWCMGMWWLLSAIIAILHTFARGERIPFKLALWGLVFPNGVQALLTIQLATALDAQLFRVLGAIYGAAVLVVWMALAIPTLMQVIDRTIFQSPCVEEDLIPQPMGNGDVEKLRGR